MKFELNEAASVQYGDMRGTVSADIADMNQIVDTLKLDGRLIRLDLSVYGGSEFARAYLIDIEYGFEKLQEAAITQQVVPVKEVEILSWSPEGHADFNPPALSGPITRLSDILDHSFKRFELRMVDKHIPDDVIFDLQVD